MTQISARAANLRGTTIECRGIIASLLRFCGWLPLSMTKLIESNNKIVIVRHMHV